MTDRNDLAAAFLARTPWAAAERRMLAGDASNRRYDRLHDAARGTTAVLMDAPPEKGEDVRPFVRIARHLTGAGLSAPEIFAADEENGFLVIEDLGDDLYSRVLRNDPSLEHRLYEAATDVLVTLHRAPMPELKPYDAPLMTELAGLAYTKYADYVTGTPATEAAARFAALFEPLLNLQRDETLTGLARGFAFRMVEGLGILIRADVQQEVKDLDQDARASLRKHGLRFGQFTIFMPLLLKPAPTRLRLVLWSLGKGLQEFPEAPPPGLVTIPAVKDAPDGYFAMCGYRAAGERAIRIDMLERLADMLRSEDSRGGFEAKPDMLSITGMTLEQFADLMQGLGYRAEKGERTKVKAVDQVVPEAAELFYTFTWGRQNTRSRGPQQQQQRGAGGGGAGAGRPQQGKGGKPRGNKPKGGKPGGNKPRNEGPRTFSAKPKREEKKIDPDNPFAAALMGLRDNK